MTQSVPMFDVYGKPTGYNFELSKIDETTLGITIDENFAGREVQEEISVAELVRLTNEEMGVHDDILGLILQADGAEIKGLVGVGSGNERFVVAKADVFAALEKLAA